MRSAYASSTTDYRPCITGRSQKRPLGTSNLVLDILHTSETGFFRDHSGQSLSISSIESQSCKALSLSSYPSGRPWVKSLGRTRYCRKSVVCLDGSVVDTHPSKLTLQNLGDVSTYARNCCASLKLAEYEDEMPQCPDCAGPSASKRPKYNRFASLVVNLLLCCFKHK